MKKILLCAAIFAAAVIFSLPVFFAGRRQRLGPPAAPEALKLSVFSYRTSGQSDSALDSLLSDFTKEYPEIKIDYDAAGSKSEYAAVLKEKIKSGSLDDVFAYIGSVSSLQDSAEDLSKQDLSMGLPYDIQRFVSQRGKIFSFPLELGTCQCTASTQACPKLSCVTS